MKIVALVPMKLNNERLPGKNIKPFDNGEPLCKYILNTLLTVTEIEDIYVYCSDESIIEYLPEGIKFLKRNVELDGDSVKINDVLISFAKNVFADVYILSHATSPFLKKSSIVEGIKAVTQNGHDSAFTVTSLNDFIWKDGKPFNYNLDNIPRSQDIEGIFIETSGLYVYKSHIILEHKRRIGFSPYIIKVSKIEAIDINEQIDFDIANSVYNFVIKKGVRL